MRERMSASLDTKEENGRISIKLRHTLNKELYNLPLTLKTYIDSGSAKVSINQGNQTISYTSGKDEKGSYVLYQTLPNSDEIMITEIWSIFTMNTEQWSAPGWLPLRCLGIASHLHTKPTPG